MDTIKIRIIVSPRDKRSDSWKGAYRTFLNVLYEQKL